MAHFFKPADAPSTGYDVDNKLAPGSVWRMQVPLFRPGTIALFDGTEDGLLIRSNNPDVVPNDGFGERKDGANRILTLYGQRTGTSLSEVRATKNGPLWSVLQVQVGDVSRAGKQEGGWVKVHRGALRPEGQPLATLCWLACFRMLYTWKELDASSIEPALTTAGIDVPAAYTRGLLPEDNGKAAKALGLSARGFGQSISPTDLKILLFASPVWAAGEWFSNSLHARVVIAVSDTSIEYFDPWYGGTSGQDIQLGKSTKDSFDNFAHGNRRNARGTDALMGKMQLLFWKG